jgi:hypothetical protein
MAEGVGEKSGPMMLTEGRGVSLGDDQRREVYVGRE